MQHAKHFPDPELRLQASARPYTGRFAPSPTGALHRGSLVAALASWLDARAHQGRWLVRIENIDTMRCQPDAAQEILRQLACFGLIADETPVYQIQRTSLYESILEKLILEKKAYLCCCTRSQIIHKMDENGKPHKRHTALVYPGTCRPENGGLTPGQAPRAWRFYLPAHPQCLVHWNDRRLGEQKQQVDETVGDFVLKRADGIWAYQLAVVADDIEQGITSVVRGEDIADNTARQILLYKALGYLPPDYLHTPLVRMPDGEKLSKQHGAPAVSTEHPIEELNMAASVLGLPQSTHSQIHQALQTWVSHWARQYKIPMS